MNPLKTYKVSLVINESKEVVVHARGAKQAAVKALATVNARRLPNWMVEIVRGVPMVDEIESV